MGACPVRVRRCHGAEVAVTAPPAGFEPRAGEAILHGHRVSYRTAGEGPVILLIHGITGDSRQWTELTEIWHLGPPCEDATV